MTNKPKTLREQVSNTLDPIENDSDYLFELGNLVKKMAGEIDRLNDIVDKYEHLWRQAELDYNADSYN